MHFTATDEVEVVPINWLREDQCLKTPKNLRKQLVPHIEKGVVASNAWEVSKVTILRLYRNNIFTFFYISRRKYWFRANFRFPFFDGFTRFGMS